MDGAGEDGSLEWYTGKEWDREAGLYYFNARWYEPETGRFTTEDPIRDQDNWYAYCGNNPLSRIDPTGLYVDYGPGGTRTEVHSDNTSTELNGRLDRTERPEPRGKIDAVAVTKGLAKGMLNGVAAPVKGLVSALKNPKATHDKAVRAIESFLADPLGVIAHGASATFDAYMNASPEEQAEMLGGYIPGIEFAVTAGGLVVGEPAAGSETKLATTPVGRSGSPLEVPKRTNVPTTIEGQTYTGHAIDQMQGRGFVPSVVEDTIKTGVKTPGNTTGTWAYTTKQAKVIVNSAGDVITVIPR